jgi:hypothetical protein
MSPVTKIDIQSRSPLAGGQSFGEFGPYEHLRGTLHFAVDPKHPDNQVIADLALAPTGPDGLVHFSSDFWLICPTNPPTNGSLVYDVANRGNHVMLGTFNDPAGPVSMADPDVGNGYLQRHGFSVVNAGWQTDAPTGLRMQAPEAQDENGRLQGQAFIQFQTSRVQPSMLLSDAGHAPLPAADLYDQAAILTVREHPDAPPTTIDRSRWQFARVLDEEPEPDATYVSLDGGFQPGMVYEIVYTTIGAPVIGLGFLAMRDTVSFLKHGTADDGNPLASKIGVAHGFGRSQSGRVLREFLYLGLNRDEQGRKVFDGVFTHTGSSRRGEFNFRFGQPSTNISRSPSMLFPMAYESQTDPVTGQTGGLYDRLTPEMTPKLIATNTGIEYWWTGASLAHTTVDGTQDVELPESVRHYYLAGTQHGQGTVPLSTQTMDGTRLEYPQNTVDYRPLLRAALVNLDEWVRGKAEPPPTLVPRLADGTAVSRESLADQLRAMGVEPMSALPQRWRLDFGPDMERGIYAYPPKEGAPYPMLVSALDGDGNEVAGVRHPDLEVPLGTHYGWNRRHAESGGAAGQYVALTGATHVFPRTAAEREAKGDPRLSIEERYPTRDYYLERVREAALDLVAQRYLLEEDVDHVVAQAGQRYDAFRGNS